MSGLLGEIGPELASETARLFGPDPQRYETAFPEPEELYDVVRSDWLFRMPSLKLAEAQVAEYWRGVAAVTSPAMRIVASSMTAKGPKVALARPSVASVVEGA